jgi:hypothetical protein
MEAHSHIAHNRRKHIGFYVKTYASMCLMWFKIFHGSVMQIINLFYCPGYITTISPVASHTCTAVMLLSNIAFSKMFSSEPSVEEPRYWRGMLIVAISLA